MKISTVLSYAGGFRRAAADVVELEKAGLDLVWVAEAYGLDSPSLMGYLAALTERVEIGSAILPIYTRTPTLIAMTAAGIDTLSDGRFHLGSRIFGSPGHRRLARRPLRRPHRSDPRDHRHLPSGVGPPRHRWSTMGRTTRCRFRPGRGPAWARRSRSSPTRCGPRCPYGSPPSVRRTWP